MKEHAAVARASLSVSPRRASPPELDDQTVVAIRLLGEQSAPDLAAHPERRRSVDLIDDREDSFGVGRVMIDQPGLEVCERLAIEQFDDLRRLDGGGRLLAECRRRSKYCHEDNRPRRAELSQHDAFLLTKDGRRLQSPRRSMSL